MSSDNERALRQRLDSALDTITPAPAPVSTVLRQGRALRTRRQVTVAAGLAVAAAVAVAAPGLVHHLGRQAPISPTRKPVVTVNPIGAGAPRGLIGSGTINGRKWRLIADRPGTNGAAKHGQCFETSGAASGGLACGDLLTSNVAGGVGFDGLGNAYYGVPSANVTRVTVTLYGGTVLVLHPVQAYGQRYFAFAVPPSLAIARIVAYSQQAELSYSIPFHSGIGSVVSLWLRPGQRGLPRAARTIGSGTVDGTTWSEAVHAGPWGYCLTGELNDCFGTQTASLGNRITGYTGKGAKAAFWTTGTATAAVDHIRVALSGGLSIRVRAVQCDGPKFFAFAVPKGHRVVRIDYYSASRHLILSQTARQVYS